MADISDMGFDAQNVEPSQERGVIPQGDYQVVMVKSERKPTKNGAGEGLLLEFQVVNGPFQNRKLVTFLNIRNQNEMAQKIAWAELSAICRAVEVMSPKDTMELHNRTLVATVTVEDDPQRGKQNRITGYKHRNAGRPQTQPINAQPAAHQFTQQAAPQQLDPFGHGPTPPPPSGGVYQQPQPVTATGSGKAWG